MNRSESGQLVQLVNSLERRTQTREELMATAVAWHMVLEDVPLSDAQVAVREYFKSASSEQRRWFVPGDIVLGVKRLRAKRNGVDPLLAVEAAERKAVPMPPEVREQIFGVKRVDDI